MEQNDLHRSLDRHTEDAPVYMGNCGACMAQR